ncbi:MAG: hypothetical protein E7175_05160 [Erysipelotrichaceae bacterium]|nr:hypothetical protein [Erysipelotrichaceae bacterium]
MISRKLFLLLPLLLTGCSTKIDASSSISEEEKDESIEESLVPVETNTNPLAKNYYQLLVYSFNDSNGDGIGDFKGIVDKLDYLTNLGIEGIWLSPIHACKSYHAYDVTDYYKTNSVYEVTIGNKKYDYKYLLDECHKKNISVIMDLVINHTSNSHVWKSEHPNWYSSQAAFPGGMSDLDYDKTEVKEAMKEVGKYWLKEGFDGFRLDAAMWLYNESGSDATKVNHQKNYAYWQEWCKAMKETKKDCYIIGEVLNKNHDLAYQYANAGFDSTFDFNVREHVYKAIKDSSYDYVGKTITDMNKALKINKDYILGRPLSNHDIGRFSQVHKGMADADPYYATNKNDLRLANALNIMMRGNTFIYYGDELGLQGTCPQGWDDMAYRTPMPFKSGKTNSVKYFNGFKGNGETTSTILSGKTADEDMNDTSSLYSTMKALLNIKKNSNAIKNGEVKKISNLPTGLNGYTLSDTTETISFIYNSTSKSITYEFSDSALFATENYESNSLNLSSKGFVVLSHKI